MMVTPLKVDPAVWARFGVVRDGRRHKVERPSVRNKRARSTASRSAVAA
jgi:hypothetical protein